jgi:transposase-like protein
MDDFDSQQEPLNFDPAHSSMCRCPYCGETLAAEELEGFLAPGSNTFICPNCRKKLNIHELGSGI